MKSSGKGAPGDGGAKGKARSSAPPPKAKPSAKPLVGKDKPEALTQDEGLQAVVLADVWEAGALGPLDLELPSALVPVAGIPAIEYTLEFLSTNDVTEVLLFVVHHVEDVRKYLESSRWAPHLVSSASGGGPAPPLSAPGAPMASPRIRLLTGKRDISSAGDALRSIDAMGLYRSEDAILLLDGMVVSNARIQTALASHVARKKGDADKDATFVTVLMTPSRGGVGAAASAGLPLHRELTVHLHPDSGQILSYDETPSTGPLEGARPRAPPAVAKGVPPPLLRTDLTDTHIYVCSQSALMHWTENYDYQHVRRDYIHNECLNTEFPFRFHAHVLGGATAYAAPLADARSLECITRDVVERRAFPLVPDRSWSAARRPEAVTAVGQAPRWVALAGGSDTSVHSSAHVSPAAVLRAHSLVCPRAVIEAGASVHCSVVGPSCVVGAGARLEHAILFSGVLVGADAYVGSGCVIGAGAVVGAGASVGQGCVIGAGVVLGDAVQVPAFTRLTTAPVPRDAFGEHDPAPGGRLTGPSGSDGAFVGTNGVGRLWPSREELLEACRSSGAAGEDDDDDEEEEGGSEVRYTPAAAAQAMAAVTAAMREFHITLGAPGGVSAAGVTAATRHVAAAAVAALSVPLLPSSAGTVQLALALGIARRSAAASPASTGPDAAGAAPTAATPAAAAATVATSVQSLIGFEAETGTPAPAPDAAARSSGNPATRPRFLAGVQEILLAMGGTGAKATQAASSSSSAAPQDPYARSRALARGACASLTPESARSLAMEVKSFRFSDNRTSSDCVDAALPVALASIPIPEPWNPTEFLVGMKRCLGAWQPVFEAFVSGEAEERAVVEALQRYALLPRERAAFVPLFGLVLSTLYDLDLTSDTAISEWYEAATEGGDQEVGALLAQKWTAWLLQRLDEEEEDGEEGEEEDGEEE